MSRIFWDTNLYIYLFEGQSPFSAQVGRIRKRMLERRDELVTSTMTLGEIQIGPRRSKNIALADKLRQAVVASSTVVSFDEKAADIYATLRENPAIKPPDAIQLSCAAAWGVELFLTNDAALQKLSVPGIHFISSLANVPIV